MLELLAAAATAEAPPAWIQWAPIVGMILIWGVLGLALWIRFQARVSRDSHSAP